MVEFDINVKVMTYEDHYYANPQFKKNMERRNHQSKTATTPLPKSDPEHVSERHKSVTSFCGPHYRKQTMSYSNVQVLSALIFSYMRVLLIVNMDVII